MWDKPALVTFRFSLTFNRDILWQMREGASMEYYQNVNSKHTHEHTHINKEQNTYLSPTMRISVVRINVDWWVSQI